MAATCSELSPRPFLSRYLAGPVAVALLSTLLALLEPPPPPLTELVALAGNPAPGPGDLPPEVDVVVSGREGRVSIENIATG